MNFIPLRVDEALREVLRHGSPDFPAAVYLRRMNRKEEGWLILHWHEELQFVLVQKGPILFTVEGRAFTLQSGDSLFIGSRALHMARPLDAVGGDYICVDVHPALLEAGCERIGRKYVRPFLKAPALQALLMDGSKTWHAQAREMLQKLAGCFEQAAFGYELEAEALLLRLWLLIVRSCPQARQEKPVCPPADEARLQRVFSYLEAHYAEKVTLRDLAEAALVSEGECCRLVRRTLGMTPMQYLNRFRVVKSAELLRRSDKSVSEIAYACGFGSSSYFTERFKETMNCRPLDYRKRTQQESI